MCDTMAASGMATATGFTMFAKNSDRERNEAQFLEMLPAQEYGRGAVVRCTYVAIPQAARTHAVMLSRPFWIWGAEMGANEHGVVIGNIDISVKPFNYWLYLKPTKCFAMVTQYQQLQQRLF